jgi:hypothetical protein
MGMLQSATKQGCHWSLHSNDVCCTVCSATLKTSLFMKRCKCVCVHLHHSFLSMYESGDYFKQKL